MNPAVPSRKGTLGVAIVVFAVLTALAVLLAAKPSQAQDVNFITVEPTEVGFGAVQVGQDSKTNTIYVRNTGDAVVKVGINALGGSLVGFDLVGHDLGDILTINPGEAQPIQVTFSPTGPGNQLATLNLTTIGSTLSPVDVDLSGVGVNQNPNAQPGAQDCDIVGTNNGETLTGTPGADTICGLGGADRINGRGANDILNGGSGNDRITGKSGKDRMLGKGGRDRLNAKDGKPGDLLKGGGGKDRGAWDKRDKVRSM